MARAPCWSLLSHRSCHSSASARGCGSSRSERDAEQPAATEGERGQRQQRERQPGAAVLPAVEGTRDAVVALDVGGERRRQQRGDIAVVEAQRGEASAGGGDALAHGVEVHAGHHDAAVALAQEAALRQRDRGAGRGAAREQRQRQTRGLETPGHLGVLRGREAVGHDQQPPALHAGAARSSEPASATAAGRSLPAAGMMSGDSAGSIAASVRASSDSGVTTCASPA